MSHAPEKKFRVEISGDATTEIVVADSNRAKIGAGVGKLSAELAPGLYKARFKAGGATRDQIFEVADGPIYLSAPRLDLRTPVPIPGTGSTHEYQEDGVRALAHVIPVDIGVGSEIALFVRDSKKSFGSGTPSEPWQDLALEYLGGGTAIDFASIGLRDPNRGMSAARVRTQSGTYLLTLARGNRPALQFPVTASEGWRTTVFLDCAGDPDVRLPDLYSASVVITRLDVFVELHDEVLRYAEFAKQSLAAGRLAVDAESMSEMLHGKFDYPMLGILAGHLLLLARKPNYALLRTVVSNLQRLVPGIPDLQALLVALAQRKESVAAIDFEVNEPPMLRCSWDILVEASHEYPELLPTSAHWMQYVYGLSGSQVWLAWQRPREATLPSRSRTQAQEKRSVTFTLGSATAGVGVEIPAETTMRDYASMAATTLDVSDGIMQKRGARDFWGQYRTLLADPSIAQTPLQSALRRRFLDYVDDDRADEEGVTLASVARDLRVPVPVLVEAANALLTVVRESVAPAAL